VPAQCYASFVRQLMASVSRDMASRSLRSAFEPQFRAIRSALEGVEDFNQTETSLQARHATIASRILGGARTQS